MKFIKKRYEGEDEEMPKPKKAKTKWDAIKLHVYLIAFCMLLLYFNIRSDNSYSLSPAYTPEPVTYFLTANTSSEIFKKLQKHGEFAFKSYFNNCLGHDEIRPITKRCLDPYGISSTLLESVETLYLLNLTDLYKQAYDYIRDNFSCYNIGWVGRAEFYSRVIGSLIGSYLLTGDKMFYTKMAECGHLAFSVDKLTKYPKPFINIQKRDYQSKSTQFGNLINTYTAGLPEMATMYQLTGNADYLNYFTRVARKIPARKNGLPFTVLLNKFLFPATMYSGPNGWISSFFNNYVLANLIHQTPATSRQVRFFAHFLNLNCWDGFSSTTSSYMAALDTEAKFDLQNGEKRMSEIAEKVKKCSFGEIRQIYENGFRFDGNLVVPMLYADDFMRNLTAYCVSNVLDNHTREFGYTGIIQRDKLEDDDTQSAETISFWLKIGALSLSQTDILSDLILNENGHILRTSGTMYSGFKETRLKHNDTKFKTFYDYSIYLPPPTPAPTPNYENEMNRHHPMHDDPQFWHHHHPGASDDPEAMREYERMREHERMMRGQEGMSGDETIHHPHDGEVPPNYPRGSGSPHPGFEGSMRHHGTEAGDNHPRNGDSETIRNNPDDTSSTTGSDSTNRRARPVGSSPDVPNTNYSPETSSDKNKIPDVNRPPNTDNSDDENRISDNKNKESTENKNIKIESSKSNDSDNTDNSNVPNDHHPSRSSESSSDESENHKITQKEKENNDKGHEKPVSEDQKNSKAKESEISKSKGSEDKKESDDNDEIKRKINEAEKKKKENQKIFEKGILSRKNKDNESKMRSRKQQEKEDLEKKNKEEEKDPIKELKEMERKEKSNEEILRKMKEEKEKSKENNENDRKKKKLKFDLSQTQNREGNETFLSDNSNEGYKNRQIKRKPKKVKLQDKLPKSGEFQHNLYTVQKKKSNDEEDPEVELGEVDDFGEYHGANPIDRISGFG
ncbi:hypothetical protein TVAG_113860 [Trichomonas vaginalis G3]|uniref:Alpha-1,2-Mannosidase n=1 Tax=Trichomonas vaginalis (strain ATCC PRA-98 / G3) TaxID=412133 RepID=A2DNN9_TRIV3|nr:mannosyl-oligosaccharide 1,2-alpha-mannosidase protein [Trichomonas vaginalis G3]EAY18042.1 hypothetical protein TVAG_113860 [Trichomonas vaginalis G3]KAI5524392.1 mannosyl-oligosaccharide 1,2-alpha-mannosidase protein [Trichomonas vaginalis G3]|eukprot:XP_001579028.1 hypothetical protein [Trichomonas vaginalis G3]